MADIPGYLIISSDDKLDFLFKSDGRRAIIKVVQFRPINRFGNQYMNLGLADLDEKMGKLDFNTVSNNGDMRKVFATVVNIIGEFFNLYPYHTIYITGQNQTRNLYYQKLVSDYYEPISQIYSIFGYREGQLEAFSRGQTYKFILIRLK
jgi:hypothetical protein